MAGLGFVLQETLDVPARHQALGRLADREAGRLVITVSPGQRSLLWLVRDIEAAFGKKESSAGGARNANERLGLVAAWGAGEAVSEIFVRRADLLNARGWATLADLAALWGARLWLSVQGSSLTRGQREFARDWGLPTTKWEVFCDQWEEQMQAPGLAPVLAPATAEAPETLPELPGDPFVTWRAACRDGLGPAQFEQVDAAFRTEFARARDAFARLDEDALWRQVRQLVEAASGLPELLLRVRAWQLAAFHSGLLLRAHEAALLGGAAPVKQIALDEALATRLRHHTQPRYPAICTLWVAGARSLADVVAVTVSDVSPDGRQVRLGSERLQLPDQFAGIMRSAVVLRQAQGATANDPLFIEYRGNADDAQMMSERAVRVLLGVLAKEHGLPLLTRFNHIKGEADAVWARRRGLKLLALNNELAEAA